MRKNEETRNFGFFPPWSDIFISFKNPPSIIRQLFANLWITTILLCWICVQKILHLNICLSNVLCVCLSVCLFVNLSHSWEYSYSIIMVCSHVCMSVCFLYNFRPCIVRCCCLLSFKSLWLSINITLTSISFLNSYCSFWHNFHKFL